MMRQNLIIIKYKIIKNKVNLVIIIYLNLIIVFPIRIIAPICSKENQKSNFNKFRNPY